MTIAGGERREYAWDRRQRLTSITFKDSGGNFAGRIAYLYDPLDHRIARTEYDVAGAVVGDERYVYDGDTLLFVFDGANHLKVRYLSAGGEIVAQQRDGHDLEWLLKDELGSIRAVVDAGDGALVASYAYDSFGNPLPGSSTGRETMLGWTGLVTDPTTGDLYAWHRWYDPRLGKWLSPDWIPDDVNNPYRYVGNGPLDGTDRSGLFDEKLVLANVKLFRPDVHQWFTSRKGQIRTEWGPFDWYFNASSAAWEGNLPVIWLHEDLNDIEAAQYLINEVTDSMEFGAYFRTRNGTPEQFGDFNKWWLKKAGEYAEVGTQAYFSVLSIANEGADFIVSLSDTAHAYREKGAGAAAKAAIGLLPFVSSGVTKYIGKGNWGQMVVPNAVRNHAMLGIMGKGFETYRDLQRYILDQAGLKAIPEGHSFHHIVQQHDRNVELFGAKMIHNEANVILLPNHVHDDITRIQNSIMFELTGSHTLTVSDYVARMKTFQDQHAFGCMIAERVLFGELKAP